jgi:hypothetical protein
MLPRTAHAHERTPGRNRVAARTQQRPLGVLRHPPARVLAEMIMLRRRPRPAHSSDVTRHDRRRDADAAEVLANGASGIVISEMDARDAAQNEKAPVGSGASFIPKRTPQLVALREVRLGVELLGP